MKRLLHGLTALVFACACVWWSVAEPRRVERVHRAIPALAHAYGVHRAPAADLEVIGSNPAIRSLLEGFGVDPATLQEPEEMTNMFPWVRPSLR